MYRALTLFLLLPTVANAAVIISEVAWMGDSVSANHEWIELQNTGSNAVDMTGWSLTDGMNLSIPLSGTIEPESYAVLERSSDASAAGAAFMIYTGALVNTGATMVLKRSDGGLEDQVAGGENWQNIGGDNITKETAQYTSGGWVTGAATPGATNSGNPIDNDDGDEEDDTDTTASSTSSGVTRKKVDSSETIRLILPDVTLRLSIDAQKVGYVNQEIDFNVEPSGIGNTLLDSLSYEWNFGDGSTALIKEPTHKFSYPGKYLVVVYGSFRRQEQLARHEITILPVALSVTTSPKGDIQLNNDSPYEIDISKYKLTAEKTFTFPDYSLVLPNQTVTVPRHLIGAGIPVIKDSAEIVINNKTKIEETKSSPSEVNNKERVMKVADETENLSQSLLEQFWRPPLLAKVAEASAPASATTTLEDSPLGSAGYFTAASTSKVQSKPSTWPYLALIGVILLGLFGTASKLARNQNQ